MSANTENLPLGGPASAVGAGGGSVVRGFVERVKASPVAVRLARGTFWSIGGAIICKALTLASSVVLARILGKAGFGKFGLIIGTVATFQVLANLGLSATANKHVAEFRKTDPQRAGRILALSGLVSVVAGISLAVGLAVWAPQLAAGVLNAPELAGPLRIASLLIFFSAAGGTLVGALSGFEAFKKIAQINLTAGVLGFPVMLAGVFYWGLSGALWAVAFSAALNLLLQVWTLRDQAGRAGMCIDFRGCGREWKVLWGFSLPALLAAMVITPVQWGCTVLLVNQHDGYAQMGLYNAAFQWRTAIMFLPVALGNMSLSVLASLHGTREWSRYRKALRYAVAVNLALVAVPAGLVMIFSPQIMRMYGGAFTSGWPVLLIMVASTLLHAPVSVMNQALASTGRMWTVLGFNLLYAAVLAGATLLAIHLLAMGLACAILVAYAAQFAALLAFMRIVRRRLEGRAGGIEPAAVCDRPMTSRNFDGD